MKMFLIIIIGFLIALSHQINENNLYGYLNYHGNRKNMKCCAEHLEAWTELKQIIENFNYYSHKYEPDETEMNNILPIISEDPNFMEFRINDLPTSKITNMIIKDSTFMEFRQSSDFSSWCKELGFSFKFRVLRFIDFLQNDILSPLTAGVLIEDGQGSDMGESMRLSSTVEKLDALSKKIVKLNPVLFWGNLKYELTIYVEEVIRHLVLSLYPTDINQAYYLNMKCYVDHDKAWTELKQIIDNFNNYSHKYDPDETEMKNILPTLTKDPNFMEFRINDLPTSKITKMIIKDSTFMEFRQSSDFSSWCKEDGFSFKFRVLRFIDFLQNDILSPLTAGVLIEDGQGSDMGESTRLSSTAERLEALSAKIVKLNPVLFWGHLNDELMTIYVTEVICYIIYYTVQPPNSPDPQPTGLF